MAWRTLDTEDGAWCVGLAVERRASTGVWQIVLSFRAAGAESRERPIWAPFPLESPSKSSLYARAEEIRDEELRGALAACVQERAARR